MIPFLTALFAAIIFVIPILTLAGAFAWALMSLLAVPETIQAYVFGALAVLSIWPFKLILDKAATVERDLTAGDFWITMPLDSERAFMPEKFEALAAPLPR